LAALVEDHAYAAGCFFFFLRDFIVDLFCFFFWDGGEAEFFGDGLCVFDAFDASFDLDVGDVFFDAECFGVAYDDALAAGDVVFEEFLDFRGVRCFDFEDDERHRCHWDVRIPWQYLKLPMAHEVSVRRDFTGTDAGVADWASVAGEDEGDFDNIEWIFSCAYPVGVDLLCCRSCLW